MTVAIALKKGYNYEAAVGLSFGEHILKWRREETDGSVNKMLTQEQWVELRRMNDVCNKGVHTPLRKKQGRVTVILDSQTDEDLVIGALLKLKIVEQGKIDVAEAGKDSSDESGESSGEENKKDKAAAAGL